MQNKFSSTIRQHLYRLLPKVYEYLSGNSIYRYTFKNVPIDSYLDKFHKLSNQEYLYIGKGVTIEKDVWINIIKEKNNHGTILIDDGVQIGQRSTLSSINKVSLGKNVLLGLNVYISDHQHIYDDIKRPVMYQGLKGKGGITIKKNSWIGNNVVILGGKDLVIGEHSIIGANSVVKESVPDYTVVVGNPAKIVKKYDKEKKRWVSIKV